MGGGALPDEELGRLSPTPKHLASPEHVKQSDMQARGGTPGSTAKSESASHKCSGEFPAGVIIPVPGIGARARARRAARVKRSAALARALAAASQESYDAARRTPMAAPADPKPGPRAAGGTFSALPCLATSGPPRPWARSGRCKPPPSLSGNSGARGKVRPMINQEATRTSSVPPGGGGPHVVVRRVPKAGAPAASARPLGSESECGCGEGEGGKQAAAAREDAVGGAEEPSVAAIGGSSRTQGSWPSAPAIDSLGRESALSVAVAGGEGDAGGHYASVPTRAQSWSNAAAELQAPAGGVGGAAVEPQAPGGGAAAAVPAADPFVQARASLEPDREDRGAADAGERAEAASEADAPPADAAAPGLPCCSPIPSLAWSWVGSRVVGSELAAPAAGESRFLRHGAPPAIVIKS